MSQKMDISLRTYQRFEKNPDDMKKIKKFASLIDVPIESLTDEYTFENALSVEEPSHRYKNKTIDVPIVKIQAGAGEGIHNFLPQQTIVSLNPTLFPFVSSGKAIAVEIIGDSMEPRLRNGDYIIITPEVKDRRDDGIYAISIDGTVKVKSLHFKLDGTIDIISENQKYATETYNPTENQVPFHIIGSIKLHISR